MGAKFKYVAAAAGIAAVIAAAAVFAYLWPLRGGKSLLAYIPEPGGTAPYILLEDQGTPLSRSPSLAPHRRHIRPPEERHAARRGARRRGPRREAAVLLERGADGAAVYCAARFTDEETKLLQKGALPAPLDAAFGLRAPRGRTAFSPCAPKNCPSLSTTPS